MIGLSEVDKVVENGRYGQESWTVYASLIECSNDLAGCPSQHRTSDPLLYLFLLQSSRTYAVNLQYLFSTLLHTYNIDYSFRRGNSSSVT
jgi:hypothetical protein